MRELGRGESFRSPRLPERAAAACGRLLGNSRLRTVAKRTWEALLDRLPGDILVSTLPGGERVRLAGAHRHMVWNTLEYEAFRQEVRPGDTVLDIGANLGGYSLLFGQWVGPSGRVHAFEPAPETRAGLLRHVRLNSLEERVVVWPDAMSDTDGTAAFVAEGTRGDNRLQHLEPPHPAAVHVRTTTIDAFCRRTACRPALIKVDVEGAELDVLRGARDTVAADPGLALYVEIHPWLWASVGASQEAFEAELAAQGLAAERLDGSPDLWTLEGVCLRLRRCAS
jgi:FkbM family methyltransferase